MYFKPDGKRRALTFADVGAFSVSVKFYMASCHEFCAKKLLQTGRFSDKLVLSEKVESVMRKHVRHFATNSMIFILIGKGGQSVIYGTVKMIK